MTETSTLPPDPVAETTKPNGINGRSRFDLGSFVAGILFMALGLAFALEADGQWTFQLSHFRYVGPLVLIVIGVSILAGAGLDRREDRPNHLH